MDDFLVDRFYEEFPFLEQVANRKSVGRIGVKRVDYDLAHYSWQKRLMLFSKDGKFIGESGRLNGICGQQRGLRNFVKWLFSDYETLERALEALGSRANEVYFVVAKRRKHGSLRITIFKTPRGFNSVAEWLESYKKREYIRERDAAAREFKDELKKADEELA